MKNASHDPIGRLLALVILAGLALAASASAGDHVWTTSGPTAGSATALAIDPSSPATLYAGFFGLGIYKSNNGGETWREVNSGLPDPVYSFTPGVQAIVVDPSASATVYAGTDLGFFKSTDGGESWRVINTGFPLNPIGMGPGANALAIVSTSPATLYAGNFRGVFKSTDGGESWSLVSTGLTNANVRSLVIDASAPATLYAGTSDGGGIFKTTDGGVSWNAINAGLPSTVLQPNTYIGALAIDPSNPTTLYAGIQNAPQGPAVFKSADGGASWSAASTGLPATSVRALVVDPRPPATLYAATLDEGGFSPGDTGSGVFKSTNGGKSWTAINTGLSIPLVQALVIDPSNSATLYAGAYGGGGVFKSTDRGGNWGPINTGLFTPIVQALFIDPSTPATLYAGTYGVGSFFKSTNGGESWTLPSTDLANIPIVALAIAPWAPDPLYVGSDESDYASVYSSQDGGVSWERSLDTGAIDVLAVDQPGGTMYAGDVAGAGHGVLKNTLGRGWKATGLTNTGVTALALDPSAPATLYAGTNGDGVFKSTDGGESWAAINTGLTNTYIAALAVDPSAPSTVYAGTYGGGIFRSTNAGGGWTPINNGLTNPLFVHALAIDPSTPGTVYAGTDGEGVFRSTNAGGSWTPINDGLANPFVYALAIDPSTPARLYAGTYGGVFEVHDYTDVGPCLTTPTTLCLGGGRFKVTTEWSTADGQSSGLGQAVTLPGGDTGYFTFFDPGDLEVMVKVLNGCDLDANFWIFAAGLTDVSVAMTVTDSLTGDTKTYTNPQGKPLQPIQDTSAFATCAAGSTAGARPYDGSVAGWIPPPSVSASFGTGAVEPCVPDATTLCLNNSRYQVRAQWVTPDGVSGEGQVVNLTGDTGAFWFFSSSNVEVVVKVLNGCGVNARYWAIAGGLTDVHVTLAVRDTQTGAEQKYVNPQGTPFQPVQDTNAFATCP